jgi:hypothetical protein
VKRVVVQYELAHDRVVEHEALLAAVFEELAARPREGVRYEVLKLGDGVTFLHVATLATESNPLATLPAFQRFVAQIDERCVKPRASSVATLFGSYPTTP